LTNTKHTDRFLLVDSLRGIAALSVALFHLSWASFKDFEHTGVLEDIGLVLQWGYLGVPIFFVISGFVIAATIKPQEVTFHYIGKFFIKRAIRLDPPYWLSMALDISLVFFTIHVFHIASNMPSFNTVLAHIFYLQGLLGIRNIAAMYWTLCLEVQFYLFLSLIFAIANKLFAALGKDAAPKYFIVGTLLTTLITSLLIASNQIENLAHMFILGAMCYWATIAKKVPSKIFFVYCAAVSLVFFAKKNIDFKIAIESLVGIATAVLLFAAAAKNKMSTWLNSRVLLYFGSISYSLYLFHAIVGERFISVFQRFLLPHLGLSFHSAGYGILLFLGATAVSILASHLVYVLIEKPSMNISKRIKPGNGASIFSDIRGNKIKTSYVPAN